MRRLTRAFYSRSALEVARDLIGCILLHDAPEGLTSVRIVETEAYLGEVDPGSHGYRGPTPRTEVMFGPPGRLYVYFTYGMHFCANVVCERSGVCSAVLLRAGEPTEGTELMRLRRGEVPDRTLAAGPGRLTQALGLGRSSNGVSLLRGSPVGCYEDAETERFRTGEIAQTVRVGLAEGKGDDLPWRFVIPGHPFASRRR